MTLRNLGAAAVREHASVYDRLGIVPVINGCGIYTDLGGAALSDSVWRDLTELNSHYVDLVALLASTGERIAHLVSADAARITPGTSAGLALASAACIAGDSPANWEQLPDTSGMKPVILLQRPQLLRYKYINPVRLCGARIETAGSEEETTAQDLRSALTSEVAALLIPAHLDSIASTIAMPEAIGLAHDAGVPVIVDAAYQVCPPSDMGRFALMGADLTCFSAKYFFGPNAGGFISGRRDLVDIVAGLDFTRFEAQPYRTFGRPFKMGRFDIAATLLALEEWFEDGAARVAERNRNRAETLVARLGNAPVDARLAEFTLDERLIDGAANNAVVVRPVAGGRAGAEALRDALGRSSPSIRVITRDDAIVIVTDTLRDGEPEIIAEAILAVLLAEDGR